MWLRQITFLLIAITLLFFSGTALAEGKKRPLWEVGIVSGYISWPHYMGSAQRYSLPVAVPYIVYRGERFRVNREGMYGLLWSRSRFAIDLGLAFHPPVKSSDNEARSGMPDLAVSGEIGPRFLALIHRSESGWQVLARVPLRLVGNIYGKTIGWTFEPNILISSVARVGEWGGYLNLGLLYGSQRYNDTYYGVADAYQTSDRPAYKASEGLHSLFATIGYKYRPRNDLSMGFYLKARFLDRGVVTDSPLTREQQDVSLGLWLAWALWESKEEAGTGDVISAPDEDAY